MIHPPGGEANAEPISGLGEGAAYHQVPELYAAEVEAIWHSYNVSLDTELLIPVPPKEPFVPLVRKVLAQLK